MKKNTVIKDNPVSRLLLEESNDVIQTLKYYLDKEDQPAPLPESVFVTYFLPYFAGLKPITPDTPIYQQWFAIAGTPFRSVNIISDQTGEVLFTCPPLIDSTGIHPDKVHQDGFNVSTFVENTKLQYARHPNLGINAMYMGTDHITDVVVDKEYYNNNSNQYQWYLIFKRYGLVEDIEQNQTKDITDTLEDDLDYDDDEFEDL